MLNEKKCLWCGELFTPTHGNDNYCCADHQAEAKRDRQKKLRDPVKHLIVILMRNHESINGLVTEGKMELTRNEIEAYGIDLSLCRHLQPPPEFEGKLLLDFGEYYLITEPNFLTFKIHKHDTETTS